MRVNAGRASRYSGVLLVSRSSAKAATVKQRLVITGWFPFALPGAFPYRAGPGPDPDSIA